jgi:UPF0755 protein
MAQAKKIIGYTFITILIILCFFAWRVFGSNTNFEEDKKAAFIKTGSSFPEVVNELDKNGIVTSTGMFGLLSKILDYTQNVKPGKYVFKKGISLYTIIRTLKSAKQTPLNLVINKLRTKEDLAVKIAANFECDSFSIIHFLNSNDSLAAFNLDTNTVMTAVVPNTYSLLWNTSFPKIFRRLYSEQQKFWSEERKKKAAAAGLSPQQVYTLASIVEEETNKQEDKGKIASVYINRINKGMRLGADPTVKFALKDFGLKRIYEKHLKVQSPYNTYLNSGLPPGPICTPSAKTIDAVLDAPATSYLYFVAKPDLNGYSNFASTYEEHLRYAKAYQQALDTLMMKKTGAIN